MLETKLDFADFKYQHVERWDTDEVEYLKDSKELWIQPKLDGTNALIAFDGNNFIIGSRNRFISVDNDNQGFAKYVNENKLKYIKYFEKNPNHILYGEFLINHVFKVKPEFNRSFYVFDVYNRETKRYLSYEDYTPLLLEQDIDYVKAIKVENINDIEEYCKNDLKNFGKFLLEDSFEYGEGFVIKDYSDSVNKYGRKTWAKILNEKPSMQGKDLFSQIREKFFTDAWIEKELIKYREKFPNDNNINKLSNILINEFIKEECANIVIKFKYPRISFQELKNFLHKILIEKLKG